MTVLRYLALLGVTAVLWTAAVSAYQARAERNEKDDSRG